LLELVVVWWSTLRSYEETVVTVLNQEIEWTTIAVNQDILHAFQGIASKTLLSPGTMLCRFITCESKKRNIPGNETFKSPWWLDWSSAFTEITRWKTANNTLKYVIRDRMAVTASFNRELDSLVQIILTKPVYGWKGITRHQYDSVSRLKYRGGGEQFFVPNLSSENSGLSSDVAYVHCFTAIESLG
jgi:hypothetical protein